MATKILVVDDSLVERLLVEGLLARDSNYRIELAEDGEIALEKMAASPPDLVVTDLVMPNLDGVELVRTVRRRYSTIPVILMTAHGDESTAVEALEAGAASYVPKAQRAERLLETVRRVAEHAAADCSRERLSQCVLEYRCRFELESDPHLVRSLVDQVQQVMAGVNFADTVERIRVGEALEEALLNALYHANLEISEQDLAQVRGELDDRLLQRLIEERRRQPELRDRRILLDASITEDEARFVVGVEGRGCSILFGGDAPGTFEAENQRSRTLIQSLMDEISFNEESNELTMTKRIVPA